jgi:hypothetical protein
LFLIILVYTINHFLAKNYTNEKKTTQINEWEKQLRN